MIHLIFIVALMLRTYRLQENLFFEGELGHNYLAIKNAVVQLMAHGTLPLLGPPTSHVWFSFGPLYYWLFGPFLALGGYHPVIGAAFFAAIGSMTVILHYLFVKKFISKGAALYSSPLVAASPFLLLITRQSRFFSLVIPLTYIFLYALFKSTEKHASRHIIWAAFIFGIILNFHLSPVVFIPPILFFVYKHRGLYTQRALLVTLVAFFIPHMPFLVADALKDFSMTKNILFWFPYRVAGFVGLYPKNTFSIYLARDTLQATLDFMRNLIMPAPWFFTFALIVCLIYILHKPTQSAAKAKMPFDHYLHVFFLGGLAGIFIHGKPPYHYFFPLVPLVFIYSAVVLDALHAKFASRAVTSLVLGIIVWNMGYLLHGHWYSPDTSDASRHGVVPFAIQETVARNIAADAHGRPFILHRVGKDDQFEGDFAQNYRYLLWYYGNEPVEAATTTYTIYENRTPPSLSNRHQLLKKIEHVYILKFVH